MRGYGGGWKPAASVHKKALRALPLKSANRLLLGLRRGFNPDEDKWGWKD